MLKENQCLKNFIKKKNLRMSSKRDLILETFLKQEEHINAEELYQKVVKKDSSIGLTTVYRTLKLFEDAGLARVCQFGKNEIRYEHCYLHNHHDHLICEVCGKVIEFENPVIEKLQEQVARQHKFDINFHRLELYGTCFTCKKKNQNKR